ncbi:hypothetical protein PAXRUDRAFT_18210 [Paxillus rubicundulus Ve08.2h10]|uniref:Uncharacterized protein n=1 Tax=Paxillus rubicundulus Ve08.2h10 TaxID=930991 RepID=A0A0D0D828_9AGAM|nr:hypothetical protein PAXRUDRAFT_18210 [Paxillus rubicundulus Ve08.2h10]
MNEDIDIFMLPQDALRNADQFLSVITAAGTSEPGYVELDELDKDSEGASKKMDIVEDKDGNTQGTKASGMTSGTAKQKPTSAGELDGANCHRELIKELQERWKCDKHSKNGTETNKWCYTPSNGGGCQPLTISNLSFWAIKIMEAGMPSMGQPGGFGFNGYPIFFIPQCRGNAQGGASTPWPLPPLQAAAQSQSQGTQSSGQSSGQLGLAPPRNSASHSSSPVGSIPDIVKWFSYLDTHNEWNWDGIVYVPFGHLLKARGLHHLNHLSLKWFQLSDLQDWLNIDFSMAINILEYAEEDLGLAKAGNLELPGSGA